MSLIPKREYITLLLGDAAVFLLSLWLALALRYFTPPSAELFKRHAVAFSLVFVIWILVFFLSGLYGKHTRAFRRQLPPTVLVAETINMVLAAIFFFFIPLYGFAPKTILLIYLAVSAPLIFFWRLVLFERLRNTHTEKGILMATGPDAEALREEIGRDKRYRFEFVRMVDTAHTPSHELIQQALQLSQKNNITFLVADFSNDAMSVALPIIYEAAFRKRKFALISVHELYEEVFDREPLSLVHYDWVLEQLRTPSVYDSLKRVMDISAAFILGLLSLIAYPFVVLAIKLDDGGPVFITLPRVGRYQQTINILKFRSMTGNDSGSYGASGKSSLKVTRVGRWLRMLRVDEFPQLWNILRGDLSFVGPRPETPALGETYNARIPYYNARYLVAPGLTGWAQLWHDRHPHHGVAIEETKEKLSYDLYYMKHRSLWLDLYIMLQTVKVVLTARGS